MGKTSSRATFSSQHTGHKSQRIPSKLRSLSSAVVIWSVKGKSLVYIISQVRRWSWLHGIMGANPVKYDILRVYNKVNNDVFRLSKPWEGALHYRYFIISYYEVTTVFCIMSALTTVLLVWITWNLNWGMTNYILLTLCFCPNSWVNNTVPSI